MSELPRSRPKSAEEPRALSLVRRVATRGIALSRVFWGQKPTGPITLPWTLKTNCPHPSLRAAIQEVADALARRDFEESSALYALAGLVPVDGSVVVRAAWEWEYAALCLELLSLSVVSELRRRFPSLPWSLIVMPPSTEEVPPSAEELPPVEEEEEVVAPVVTRTTKGKAKAVEESRPEKVPRLRAKRTSQQIEVGPRNERP
ncbi:hypothetical protein NEOLEDRAFT_1184707, partial [Neolentinus lepideus HHB14362 ss-1]